MKKELNKVRCVDCLHFKTRTIKDEKALRKDEFRFKIPLQRQFTTKEEEDVRIYYCTFERRPLLESKSVHDKVKPNCEKAVKI